MNRQPPTHPDPACELLVSVRNVTEARSALAGGAAVIDVKEPARGSLGRADDAVLAGVLQAVAGARPVSAALGELVGEAAPPAVQGLAFVKWGLAGCRRRSDWQEYFVAAADAVRRADPGCRVVPAIYADWQRAEAPPPQEVVRFARRFHLEVVLVDTWHKDGSGLLDWLAMEQLARLCRQRGLQVALAGSLAPADIERLRHLRPRWFAVRGSVCDGGRLGPVDRARVAQLAALLASCGSGGADSSPPRRAAGMENALPGR
jgi:hypothetical protein